jgi:hypothetical protein
MGQEEVYMGHTWDMIYGTSGHIRDIISLPYRTGAWYEWKISLSQVWMYVVCK